MESIISSKVTSGDGRLAEGVESTNKKLLFRVVIGTLRKENRCYGRNCNSFRIVWFS